MISMEELRRRIIDLRDAAEAQASKLPMKARNIWLGNAAAFVTVLEMIDGLPEEEKPPRKMAPSIPPPVKFCAWCDDCRHPSIEHHPNGQAEHV